MAAEIRAGTPAYKAIVARGKEALGAERDARFTLGDLALQLAPMTANSAKNGSQAILTAFANDLGISFERVQDYREVAAVWPPDKRNVQAAWTVYRELRSHPDRFKLLTPGMSADDAIRAGGRKPNRPVHTHERATQVAKWVAADPAVAAAIVADPVTAQAIHRADNEQIARKYEEARRHRDADPTSVKLRDNSTIAALSGANSTYVLHVRDLLDALAKADVTEDKRADLIASCKRVQMLAGWAIDALQGTPESVDDELRNLIDRM